MKEKKKEIYGKLTEMAKIMEKFGLGCIVVDNPFRKESNEGVSHCFIITQPTGGTSGRVFPKEEFHKLLKDAEKSCRQLIREDHLLLDIGPMVIVDSLADWLKFSDSQKKHPILHGFPYGATDVFLSKVIYGRELHEKIIRAFQSKYGENFIQECYSVWMEERKRRRSVIDLSNRELTEEFEERKKPFNKYEMEEINDFLLDCLKFSLENKISAIVGIDRSGRPLAQMLEELLGKIGYKSLFAVDFLDPHRLKREVIWESADKLKIPDVFIGKFKEEFPVIFRLLRKDPDKVLFIDDQMFSYFQTAAIVNQLIKQVAQKEDLKFSFWVVSGFNGYNGLTWWKNKRLLRINSNKDCKEITLRSIPREISVKEEEEIKNFERKLSKITEKVFKTWDCKTETCLAAR